MYLRTYIIKFQVLTEGNSIGINLHCRFYYIL